MSKKMSRQAIMRKTMMVGSLTAMSRMLAMARAFLQLEYLGLSGLSDAFLIAFRIPNFLRKIFAEGALSAAFVPVIVQLIKKDDRAGAHSLMSYAFILFEGVLVLLTLLVWWQPQWVVTIMAPGFSAGQVAAAAPLTRILFPFILCISSGALLAGALQAVNCFSVNAFGPVLLNIFYLLGLMVCLKNNCLPSTLAWFIMAGGLAHFLLHLRYYFSFKFSFGPLTKRARPLLGKVLSKFGPALLGMSVLELNVLLDGVLASYLPPGSVTMLHYGNRFMGVPLGVFGVAFATVLLAHFSRTSLYARSRFGYYMLETTKLIIWLMLPATLALWHVAPEVFATFLAGKASAIDIAAAAMVLRVYAVGLIFFCLNKVIMNLSYALQDTWIPTWATVGATILNVLGNLMAVYYQSRVGIALSTVLSSGLFVTVFMLVMLSRRHNVKFYAGRLLRALPRLLSHVAVIAVGFMLLEWLAFLYVVPLVIAYAPVAVIPAFAIRLVVAAQYWMVVGPLLVVSGIALYMTRRLWKQKLYFAS